MSFKRCMNICISGISQAESRLCLPLPRVVQVLLFWEADAKRRAQAHREKELWVESQRRSELWWPVCWNEKERDGCVVVVPFGIIKTESSARERRNEKYSRTYAKRKAKGKSFCWLNYINMTNDFFGIRDRARWRQTHVKWRGIV